MPEIEKLVTVIVPVYNCRDSIKGCLDSLAAQTLEKDETEILIINDGSTDDTLEICRDFAAENGCVTIISQEHLGVGAARNCGIASAKGKYITFVDADDSISPNALKSLADFFEENYERTDILTYKLVPQVRGKNKKSSFVFDILKDSAVYDLTLDENLFACVNRINVMVKNRKNNVLFDCDESDLDTTLYCYTNIRDKMNIGFVGGCEYYAVTNPSGIRKGMEASIYYDTVVSKWEALYSRYNEVPEYLQALFTDDLIRRIRGDFLLPYHLTGDDFSEQVQRLEKLLERTENKIILAHPDAGLMNQYYLIGMKYKGDLDVSFSDKVCLEHNGEPVCETDEFDLVITRFKIRDLKVEVCGYVSSPIFDYCEKPTLYLRERDGYTTLELKESSFCYDRAKIKNNTAWGFRTVIDAGKRVSFSFAIGFGDRTYPVKLSFGEWVPFNLEIGRTSFVLNGVSCRLGDRYIAVKKAAEGEENKYKRSELIKYLKTNKKVFAVRLLNLLMPKKRIWLYHDCKGVGVDNAYYQFIHDFEINDGVERYYVVNGSAEKIRDKFTPEQQKHILAFRSSKHKLMYLKAERIITAFIEKENYLPFYNDIYPHYIDLFGGYVYYLQHGVLHAHLPWKYSYDRLDVSGEVISTNYEAENFTKNYFFPDSALIKSKMPRYDFVDCDAKAQEGLILFAPSWRKYLITHKGEGGWSADRDKFINSDYFKKTQDFLNSDALAKLLEENDMTLEFKLHPIFSVYTDCFKINNPRVSFAADRPISDYKIFITDYSSFVFDFVYLNRAIVYFMPDLLQFKSGMNDYRELDIPFEKGFGELTQNTTELCNALQRIVENSGEAISPYAERTNSFFLDTEKNSRDRIYEALK